MSFFPRNKIRLLCQLVLEPRLFFELTMPIPMKMSIVMCAMIIVKFFLTTTRAKPKEWRLIPLFPTRILLGFLSISMSIHVTILRWISDWVRTSKDPWSITISTNSTHIIFFQPNLLCFFSIVVVPRHDHSRNSLSHFDFLRPISILLEHFLLQILQHFTMPNL